MGNDIVSIVQNFNGTGEISFYNVAFIFEGGCFDKKLGDCITTAYGLANAFACNDSEVMIVPTADTLNAILSAASGNRCNNVVKSVECKCVGSVGFYATVRINTANY